MRTQQEIEKEIRKIFDTTNYVDETEIAIADFLHKIRQDDIKSLIEQLEKEKKDSLWIGEDPETEEMKVMEPDQLWGEDMSFAYNLALDNVISYLKSQLKD
jgi:uncharacterized protein YktB (UPF0637 family)